MTKPTEQRSGSHLREQTHHLNQGHAWFAPSQRQLTFGWWALLIFLALGIVLELLHGFKVRFYLDVANETRRLMWTLAHAHGTLLSLINIAFGLTIRSVRDDLPRSIALASRCLIGATVLLPAGFFLGGMFIHAGDPGLPILLVPLGAVMLLAGVFSTARISGSIQRAAIRRNRADR